jgi:hypothetical protein
VEEEALTTFLKTLENTQPSGVTVTHYEDDTYTKGIPMLSELKSLRFDKIDGGFKHRWPKTKDDLGNSGWIEEYDIAYMIKANSWPLVLGLGHRESAGKPDRRRGVMFLGEMGRTLLPLVEWSGANDYDISGRMVSILKSLNNKQLELGAPLPPGYNGMPLDIYKQVVVGPNAYNRLCVVANNIMADNQELPDFPVMVRHALLRARQKKMI